MELAFGGVPFLGGVQWISLPLKAVSVSVPSFPRTFTESPAGSYARSGFILASQSSL